MKHISLEKICKSYDKKVYFINNFNLEIEAGQILGMIGHNGSGKSTLLKMMATLTIPDSGQIYFDDVDVIKRPQLARRKLGVFLEPERSLYWRLTGDENLRRVAELKGIPKNDFRHQADYYLEKLGLSQHRDKLVSQYSKGMKVKLNIISTVLGHPEILLFDEPLAGLDHLSKLEALDLITSLSHKENIIVICSNNLIETQKICDRILLMKGGKSLAYGAPAELLSGLPGEGIIEITTGNIPEMSRWLKGNLSIVHMSDDGEKIVVVVDDLIQCITAIKKGNPVPYINILYREKDLTDYFIIKNQEETIYAGKYEKHVCCGEI